MLDVGTEDRHEVLRLEPNVDNFAEVHRYVLFRLVRCRRNLVEESEPQDLRCRDDHWRAYCRMADKVRDWLADSRATASSEDGQVLDKMSSIIDQYSSRLASELHPSVVPEVEKQPANPFSAWVTNAAAILYDMHTDVSRLLPSEDE